ncbi:MAG: sigma-70 family RNA polymerase sigma factor [Alphaproteobacteria bacterium]|jgi:RNA polymerase sigma-70 factor (ECF subfamily)|nr:sigma-70 family RNA polymerase sigma factor [Alphaproteobacteria bacterium]
MSYNLHKLSDEDLMKNIAKGDEISYSILVDRYLNKAISYAKKLYIEDYEDLVQRVFLKIWKMAKYYNSDKAKFSTWFYRILQNQSYDDLRKVKREKEFIEEYKSNIPTISSNLEDNLLNETSNKSLVILVIKNLKSREQKVIILRYLEEMSIKEVSEIMKSSEKAIETLLTRTKKKMLDILNKENYEI